MNLFATPDTNAISLITHVDEIANSVNSTIKNIKFLCGENSCNSEMINEISMIEDCIKTISPKVMLSLEETKSFMKYLCTMNETLRTIRDHNLNVIDKRRNTEVQMNTMGEMYDEENLITDISVSIKDKSALSVWQVSMETVEDTKEYSILSLITRYENEAESELLEDICSITKSECVSVSGKLSSVKEKINALKNICTDTEFISMICDGSDSNEVKVKIGDVCTNINECILSLNSITDTVKRLFQIYQELIHNNKIYSKAITTYTSFTLECFFNDHSTYEIC